MPAASVPLLHAIPRTLRHARAVPGFTTAMSRLQRDPVAWRGAGLVAEHPPFARPDCIPPAPAPGRAPPSHLVAGGRIQPASWSRVGKPARISLLSAATRRWEPSAKGGSWAYGLWWCRLRRSWAGRPRSGNAPRIPWGRARGAAVAAAGQGVIFILFFSLNPTKYSCLKL